MMIILPPTCYDCNFNLLMMVDWPHVFGLNTRTNLESEIWIGNTNTDTNLENEKLPLSLLSATNNS